MPSANHAAPAAAAVMQGIDALIAENRRLQRENAELRAALERVGELAKAAARTEAGGAPGPKPKRRAAGGA